MHQQFLMTVSYTGWSSLKNNTQLPLYYQENPHLLATTSEHQTAKVTQHYFWQLKSKISPNALSFLCSSQQKFSSFILKGPEEERGTGSKYGPLSVMHAMVANYSSNLHIKWFLMWYWRINCELNPIFHFFEDIIFLTKLCSKKKKQAI